MRIELTIRLLDNGMLSVEGPIEDKDRCIWLLENAIEAIREERPGASDEPRKEIA